MKKLSQAGFNRARDFLYSAARPLEKATFEMEFEHGSVDEILLQLAIFQNPDGGFGHALEPDLRAPTSSALCTEIGLRTLAEWQTPASHPMVRTAVKYLLESFDADTQVWRVIPTDANHYPHAPWWHEENGSVAQNFDNFLLTPRAGILAALWHYAELVPADWLNQITEDVVTAFEQTDDSKFGGGDPFVYALRLAESVGLPGSYKARMESRLKDLANKIVTREPEKWSSYCVPPLKIASSPKTLTAVTLAEEIQIHLDYLIEHQSPAGNWEPNWSWFGSYPDQWEQAKIEWQGMLTMETLLLLKSFGRIER